VSFITALLSQRYPLLQRKLRLVLEKRLQPFSVNVRQLWVRYKRWNLRRMSKRRDLLGSWRCACGTSYAEIVLASNWAMLLLGNRSRAFLCLLEWYVWHMPRGQYVQRLWQLQLQHPTLRSTTKLSPHGKGPPRLRAAVPEGRSCLHA